MLVRRDHMHDIRRHQLQLPNVAFKLRRRRYINLDIRIATALQRLQDELTELCAHNAGEDVVGQ